MRWISFSRSSLIKNSSFVSPQCYPLANFSYPLSPVYPKLTSSSSFGKEFWYRLEKRPPPAASLLTWLFGVETSVAIYYWTAEFIIAFFKLLILGSFNLTCPEKFAAPLDAATWSTNETFVPYWWPPRAKLPPPPVLLVGETLIILEVATAFRIRGLYDSMVGFETPEAIESLRGGNPLRGDSGSFLKVGLVWSISD